MGLNRDRCARFVDLAATLIAEGAEPAAEIKVVTMLFAFAVCTKPTIDARVAASVVGLDLGGAPLKAELREAATSVAEGKQCFRLPPADSHMAFLLGFTLKHLFGGFAGVRLSRTQPSPVATELAALLDRLVVLHGASGLLRHFPVRCLVVGLKASLFFRCGRDREAVALMSECVRLADADPLARCSFPIVRVSAVACQWAHTLRFA